MTFNKIKSYVINPLDICIIVIVAAIILTGFIRLNNEKIFLLFNKAQNAEITLTLPINSELTEKDVKNGDEIYLSETGKSIGVVKNVTIVNEKKYSALNNTLWYDYTDKNVALLVTVDTKIKVNDSRRYLDDAVFVSPGMKIDVFSANFESISAEIDEIVDINI